MALNKTFLDDLALDCSAPRGAGAARLRDDELDAHALVHPTTLQVSAVLTGAFHLLRDPTIAFLAAYLTSSKAFIWLGLVLSFNLLQYVLAVAISLLHWQRNRPDVFLGWAFSSAVDDTRAPVSAFCHHLIVDCLRPAWGAVLLPSYPASAEAIETEAVGNRGMAYPLLRARQVDDWKNGVLWLLTRVRLAVFEVPDNPGESILWEIDQALRILGPDRVIVVKRGRKGLMSAWLGGNRMLPIDPALNSQLVSIPTAEMRPAFQVLTWCAKHFPVNSTDMAWNRFWNFVWELKAHWSGFWVRVLPPTLLILIVIGLGESALQLWRWLQLH